MPNSEPSYFRRDLTTLLVLVVIIAVVVGGLWYVEQRDGSFSRAALSFLDSLK